MPRSLHDAAREIVSHIMKQTGIPLVEIEPVAEELGHMYPDIPADDILHSVINAEAEAGGACSWNSRH